MIAILDYGVGNVQAFANVYRELGLPYLIAGNSHQLSEATKIILPGVGHYDFVMQKLMNSGMIDTLQNLVINKRIPILGVCVGMQIMANESEEGSLKGLGWVDGKVIKLKNTDVNQNTILPHMGWNSVISEKKSSLFDGIEYGESFYFLHSFAVECADKNNVLAITNYGDNFASIIQKDNIFGMQCHPEKSHSQGTLFLKNFATL